MKFDKRTKKLMSEFFYDCHQKLWDRIIEEMEGQPITGWGRVDDDKAYEKMFQMIIDMTEE